MEPKNKPRGGSDSSFSLFFLYRMPMTTLRAKCGHARFVHKNHTQTLFLTQQHKISDYDYIYKYAWKMQGHQLKTTKEGPGTGPDIYKGLRGGRHSTAIKGVTMADSIVHMVIQKGDHQNLVTIRKRNSIICKFSISSGKCKINLDFQKLLCYR